MESEEITKEEETVEELLAHTNTEVTEEEEKSEVKTTTEPKLARVEYDYEAKESDELSLNVGDIITVLEQNEGGWWKGDLHGKTGTFPENHVKLIEVPTQSVAEEEEGVKKKTLNKYGVKAGGLGSLFAGGVPTLKKRSQPSPENSSVSEEKHVIASPPVLKKTSVPSPVNQQPNIPLPNLPPKKKPPKPKKVEPKAEVMYDYEAEEDGEISLIPGTLVTILEKNEPEGWWTGRNEQGKVGMFPSTYVKEIKQTEVQQRSQSASEETTVEEVKRQESSEVSAMITQEVVTSEPASVSADSPPSSIHSSSNEVNNEDSQSLPKSPPPLARRTTSETSSPPATNRRSTHESSQVTAPKRRSIHESTSPTSPRNSSHDVEEHVTSRRPPSVVSPDLPPIQSISTNFSSTDISPISPKERPTAPPRQSSRPLSLHENKTESPKSPTLAKPPKSFSPAKPPVVSPVKRSSSSSSKSDKTKNENSPTEPVSPKINRKTSYDQRDSSTALSEPSEPENKDDDVIEDEEKTAVAEKLEIREEVDKEAEISDGEEKEEEVTENLDNKDDDDDTTGGHEVEPEEKKPQSQLPPLPIGPKLTSLQKDRPNIKNRKTPSVKSIKESASQSQTAILLESVSSAKDEVEQKPQPVASPPTPPKPEKPEKPVKPNTFKLPTLGAGGIQLRSVAKKPSIETSTESTETTTSSTTSSGIDTKPISGGVKGISSRFNQFGGIPNSSDVEFRLKKWFNEEINKVKSNFEAKLAEERSKREALEEEFKELLASLQEN